MEAGLSQVRTELAAGYGRPHYSWVGVSLSPKLTPSAMLVTTWVTLALPRLELHVGARYVTSLERRFLAPRDAFVRDDLELHTGSHARYVSLDAELSGSVPAPLGKLSGLFAVDRIVGVPDGQYVFDESVKAVIKPPVIWRGRLVYSLELGRGGFLQLGPLLEAIGIPGRDETILRTGPIATLRLSPRLDAIGMLAFVIESPDSLGLLGGDTGQIGLRFRWATGDPNP